MQPAINVAAYLDENAHASVKTWVKQNARNYSVANNTVDCNGIYVTFNGFSIPRKMIAFICDIADYLATLAPADACPFCGEPLEDSLEKGSPVYISCNGNSLRIHDNCYDGFVERAAKADAEVAAAPGNYPKGALGMFLGSLVGGGLFIGLYLLGYIAWIAPLLAAFLGSYLYGKFGGKNDKTKIIILWAVTVVVMAVAIFVAIYAQVYILASKELAKYGLEITDYFQYFNDLMSTEPLFRSAVLRDSIISIVLLVVANGYMTYVIIKAQRPKTTVITRINQ